MSERLAGRNVVITGDARGIGAAVARGAPHAGARAACIDVEGPGAEATGVDARRCDSGRLRPTGFTAVDPGLMYTMIDRNLTTTFHTALVFARLMATEHAGSIVLVSSQLSGVFRPGLAHHEAAKRAINQLVRGMAVDPGPLGIRTNAFGPGPTETPRHATWFARPAT